MMYAVSTLIAIAITALLSWPRPIEPGDLQAMIDQAPPGSVVTVPAGTYKAPVEIGRSLTLIAAGEVIIQGPGEGDVVRVTAPDVTLRGFTIRGTGISLDRENAAVVVNAPRVNLEENIVTDALFGFYLKEAPDSIIRRNRIEAKQLHEPRRGDAIRLWQSSGCIIEDNIVRGSRDVIVWFSEHVTLRDNIVTNGRYGMHFMYSSDAILEDNTLTDNSVGTFLMYSRDLTLRRNILARNRGPSGFGIGLKDMDGLIAENNIIVGNRVGMHLDNSPSRVDVSHMVRNNVFAYNDIGLGFLPNVTRNTFTENSFVDNIQQVAILGSGTLKGNEFAVGQRGNYWSDYQGFDLDQNDVGDFPYRSDAFFEDLMDRHPRLRLFMFSPAQNAIEMAARALPIITPRLKITDPSPLMQIVPAEVPPVQTPGGNSIAAAWLLIAAGLGCIVPAVGRAEWKLAARTREKGNEAL